MTQSFATRAFLIWSAFIISQIVLIWFNLAYLLKTNPLGLITANSVIVGVLFWGIALSGIFLGYVLRTKRHWVIWVAVLLLAANVFTGMLTPRL